MQVENDEGPKALRPVHHERFGPDLDHLGCTVDSPGMSKRKTAQSRAELLRHLGEQVEFMRASMARFDSGHQAEAKRLAASVRILLRDSRNSSSLLGQLGTHFEWRFVDSVVVPLESINKTCVYHGLMSMAMGGGKAAFEPLCWSEPRPVLRRRFLDWWSRMIMRDSQGNAFTRESLVLTVADQDGGAHIDPQLDESYAALSRQNSLGVTFGIDGPEPKRWFQDPVPVALRQIAQEVVWTLEDQGLVSGA
jgi:hypothetical protein